MELFPSTISVIVEPMEIAKLIAEAIYCVTVMRTSLCAILRYASQYLLNPRRVGMAMNRDCSIKEYCNYI
jgi:hypothetical protein